MSSVKPLIQTQNLQRSYAAEGVRVDALRGVTFEIAQGEFVAITGPSGCGKSTLLHLLGGLDAPTAGTLEVAGIALHQADDAVLTEFRRTRLGMVFQFFHLLPTMNVLENICFPLLIQGRPAAEARARAGELLEIVGLTARANHFTHQLSGGEMQRTAIARALVHRPPLLLADEPTGNLDSANAALILDILHDIHTRQLATIVLVTHSSEIASGSTRRIRMRDGEIES